MIFFKETLFSRLNTGKMHLLNKNLPMKECLKYLGNLGNRFEINISMILHTHLTV